MLHASVGMDRQVRIFVIGVVVIQQLTVWSSEALPTEQITRELHLNHSQ
jgi:hypothetical protein